MLHISTWRQARRQHSCLGLWYCVNVKSLCHTHKDVRVNNVHHAWCSSQATRYALQSQNSLQGSIPQQISLANLVVLDLSRNQLEGFLPELPHNEKLQMALFSHNRFSGSIPAPPPANQFGPKCELLFAPTMLPRCL